MPAVSFCGGVARGFLSSAFLLSSAAFRIVP